MDTLLTTIDNPYDPFTQYDEWQQWDTSHGYHTERLIARVSNPSLDIEDDAVLDELYDMAAMSILENDITGQYTLKQGQMDDTYEEEETL